MQMVKKGLIYSLVILFSLALFAPKRELYYLLEGYLLRQDIIIDDEEIRSGLLSLKLEHPVLYVKGIELARVKEISLHTLLFYTYAAASGIVPDRSLKRLLPGKIEDISLRYQLLDPLRIRVKLKGDFGTANGYIAIRERKVHLDFSDIQRLKGLRSMLKKGEKGWYYETTF